MIFTANFQIQYRLAEKEGLQFFILVRKRDYVYYKANL